MLYLFDNYVLDTDQRELRRDRNPVPLQPQVFDLLELLIRNRDRVVTKDDLMAAVWGGRIVSESSLTTRINAARTAIGDSGEAQRLIKTFQRKGVRFVGTVREEKVPEATADTPAKAAGPLLPRAVSAERRQLTVASCELLIARADGMDPEDLREIILSYHGCLADIARRYGGSVGHAHGNAASLFFGHPEAHEDDAERAVHAALTLIAAVAQLRTSIGLQARIGIATGMVIVGDPVSPAAEPGIIGEILNITAWLLTVAEPNMVVVAESTRRFLGELFELHELGTQLLKGTIEPTRVFRALRPSSVESRFEALHSGGLTTLVGREEELELLLRRWSRAKAGEGQVVLLSGEAGIGKSRLTAALLENLAAERHARLRYFCSSQHTVSALYPFIGQIERSAGFAHGDDVGSKLNKLDALLALTATPPPDAALVAELLSLPADGRDPAIETDPQLRRQKTLKALISRTMAPAEKNPVLMVFEDVHWIDPTSLELLGRVIEQITNKPVLLIITFRPEFEAPWIGSPHVTLVTINRLTERDVSAMIEGVVGNKKLPANLAAEIVARTDGIPLFVEEMTKAVLESGNESDAGRTEASVPSSGLSVPPSLHASLMARLDRLGDAKEIAQIGAAIGRQFSHSLLRVVAHRPEAELGAALERVIKAGLLFRQGEPPHATYLFKHALVQDAAYGTLIRQPRRDLHRQIATALVEIFSEIASAQPEIVAYHYQEAGLYRNAAEWRVKAGQRALRRSAFEEAARQFCSGLSIAEATSDHVEPKLEAELQTGLGFALTATRGYASRETGEAFTRARMLCQKLNDTKALARVGYGQYLYYLMSGQILASERLARETVELGEKLGSLEVRFLGLRTLGVSLLELGDLTGARRQLEECVNLIRSQPGSDVVKFSSEALVMIWTWLSYVLVYQGHIDEATQMQNLAEKEARQSRSAHTQAFSMGFGAAISFLAEKPDLLARGEALLDLADNQSLELHRGIGMMFVGSARMRLGDPDAPNTFRAGLHKYLETGARWGLPGYLWFFASGLSDSDPEKQAAIDRAFEAVGSTQERIHEAELHRERGNLARARADFGVAERSYLEAIRVADAQGSMLHKLKASVSLARLWRDQGRVQIAREILEPVIDWFAEQPEVPLLKRAREFLSQI